MTSLFGLLNDATATKIRVARLNYRLSGRIENETDLFDQFESSFDSYHRQLSFPVEFLTQNGHWSYD